MKDILGVRRDARDKRYDELLLKNSGVADILRHLVKKFTKEQFYMVGFYVLAIVDIILVVRK